MIKKCLKVLTILLRPFFGWIEVYVDLFVRVFEALDIRVVRLFGLQLELPRTRPAVDERLAKIDSARASLNDVITAMDELKKEAEAGKREVAVMANRLVQIEQTKQSAEKELEQLKAVINLDMETFKKVAGIPSPTQIRRDRYIGFASGVVASILAAVIVWITPLAIKYGIGQFRRIRAASTSSQEQKAATLGQGTNGSAKGSAP